MQFRSAAAAIISPPLLTLLAACSASDEVAVGPIVPTAERPTAGEPLTQQLATAASPAWDGEVEVDDDTGVQTLSATFRHPGERPQDDRYERLRLVVTPTDDGVDVQASFQRLDSNGSPTQMSYTNDNVDIIDTASNLSLSWSLPSRQPQKGLGPHSAVKSELFSFRSDDDPIAVVVRPGVGRLSSPAVTIDPSVPERALRAVAAEGLDDRALPTHLPRVATDDEGLLAF